MNFEVREVARGQGLVMYYDGARNFACTEEDWERKNGYKRYSEWCSSCEGVGPLLIKNLLWYLYETTDFLMCELECYTSDGLETPVSLEDDE